MVTIEHPMAGAIVGLEEIAQGTFRDLKNANDVQAWVFSPDNNWYLQGPPTITHGRWSRKVWFGNKDQGMGKEFKLAVLAEVSEPRPSPAKQLPNALGRSIVRITRRS